MSYYVMKEDQDGDAYLVNIGSEEAALPNEDCARSRKNPDNSFFISKESGEIVSRAYRDEKGYFPSIPTGTAEIIEAQTWGIRKEEGIE